VADCTSLVFDRCATFYAYRSRHFFAAVRIWFNWKSTMTLQKQTGFWVIALIAFIAILWLLQDILLPFTAGFVLAYFLDPVADALERWGFPRLVATLLILLVAVSALVLVFLIFVPVLGEQAIKLAQDLPDLAKALVARLDDVTPQSIKDLLLRAGGTSSGSFGDMAGKMTVWMAAVVQSLWSGGMALVNVLSLLIVTPIVAFYLLADWDKLVAIVDSWLPRDHVVELRTIARDIDAALAGFIRGQGTVCLLLGIFYAVALTFAGLKFGLAIGLGAGLLSFIPYVGAIIGGVLAIGVGLVQFWPDYTSVLLIAGIFAAGQFFEGNFLSPKLVGGSIGLHPVWLMFALFAFGYLFGFVGLLLAVPLAAAAGVLVRYGLQRYLQSRLYRGLLDGKLTEKHKEM
jgi:predicted PurR-regulated permease PerM